MPPAQTNFRERYELGEVLGRGSGNVVYRAYDRLMQREVVLKTLQAMDNPATLDLFYKEFGLLASMVHPNIVNIWDLGEFNENGVKKPFFAMPLLTGATLDRLLLNKDSGLNVERLIGIVTQAGRGLQAAHDMGLVHRDIKPSNIFVMDDGSAKIIDFGVARPPSIMSMTVLTGTLSYMAPEQVNHKPATHLTDQYSLAVVLYEALTSRKPFQGPTDTDLAEAIMRGATAAVSDVNPGVNYAISQVLRKAMARQPEQRFGSTREFTDALNRAARGEGSVDAPIDKIKPRLDRATTACEQGDFEFASELLSQLESEGYLNESMTALRHRIDQEATRKRVNQLLDSGSRYLQAEEYPLALRKVQDALELDPGNSDAQHMRERVEQVRRDRKVEEWLQLARAQAENQSFHMARESLTNALKIKPNDPEASRMLADLTRREEALSQPASRQETQVPGVSAPPPPPPPPLTQTGSQDKRELIRSVLEKARFFEDRKRFAEACDQLQILKAIEPNHPGIDAEIERMSAMRDGQARGAARERYSGYISTSIQAGDYERAQRTIEEALREYPSDPEFSTMSEQVRQGQERTANSLAVLEQARAQAEKASPDAGIRLLRQAYEMDSGNPVVRTVATTMFLDLARKLMLKDPDSAERVAAEALQIEPGHADAQAMLRQIAQRRRQEFVDWCVAQAHRMRAEGDMAGAMAVVHQGLGAYPDDQTLQQLEAELSGRAAPPPPPPPSESQPVHSGSLDATGIFAGTPDLEPLAPMPPPPQYPPQYQADMPMYPPDVPMEPPPGMPPMPPPAAAAKPKRTWIWAAAGAFVVLALGAGGWEYWRTRKPKPKIEPVAGGVKVEMQATPSGALILVDGQECGAGTCSVTLAPGEHRAEAKLDGYSPASNTFTIPPNAAGSIPAIQLALSPQLPVAIVTTNLAQATVTLDDGQQQPVQNGELQLSNLPAGQRTIKFNGDQGMQGTLKLTVAPAAVPRVDGPIQQQNVDATVVSMMGGSARVLSTLAKADVTVDGKPAGKSEPGGLDVNNLAPGAHEVVITAQNTTHRLTFTSGPAPTIAVFFGGVERNQGVLRVNTGESDVAVYVNGMKFRRATRDGKLILYLEPKTYKIRVEKDGFQAPAEQTVEVKKGAEARADFVLTAHPQTGSVMVAKAPAGADITLDGAPAGKARPDGTLGIRDLKPGSHSIVIKKDGFKPVTREFTIAAGRQADVDGSLQASTGTVKISVAPPDVQATLMWKREGDEDATTIVDNPLSLPEGTYTIIARAPGHEEAKTTVKVTAGRMTNAVLLFPKVVVEKKEPPKPRATGLDELEKSGGWTRENGSLTRTGGNIVALPIAGSSGTYSFQALMIKGKRLEWVVNYVDPKNYVAWELNDDHLERYEMVDGRKQNTVKPKIRVKIDQWVQVTMDVTATAVNVTVKQDAATVSDRVAHDGPTLTPGQSLVRGKFGFRIPGKDRLVVGTFVFTPK